MFIVNVIVPYNMNHNAEPEAVDLLMEVEKLDQLVQFTNENNYERVGLYLLSCSNYAADTDEMMKAFRTAFEIYMKHNQYPLALRVAQKMNDNELVKKVFTTCRDNVTLKQLAFMIGRQRTAFDLNSENPVFAKLEADIPGIKEIFS